MIEHLDNFWKNYQIRLEPWGIDYDTPVQFSAEETPADIAIDLNVEQPEWLPCQAPNSTPLPERLLFVDGRRRVDARFMGRNGHDLVVGAFGTVAVGGVLVDRGQNQAVCLKPIVRRVIATGGGFQAPKTQIPVPNGGVGELSYDLIMSDRANDPQTPTNLIQEAMLTEESRYASQFAAEPNLVVVRDGPLLYQPYRSPDLAVGYVKTMGRSYLKGDYGEILWQLKPRERTPIFALGESGSPKRRWSWYLRSGQPGINSSALGYHGLHGIVRMDLYGDVELELGIAVANQMCILIPEYASTPTAIAGPPRT
ncbi:MAG: hypothetical protein HC835_03940 [Oscillatoriales cyanobacterium RM2_1_1]|nr:hypothetical protein [Oscillatoriales cyanobacterium RM2_1_1]